MLGTITHIEGNLVAWFDTTSEQVVGKIVGATLRFAPCYSPFTLYQGGLVGGCDGHHGFNNVAIVSLQTHRKIRVTAVCGLAVPRLCDTLRVTGRDGFHCGLQVGQVSIGNLDVKR